MATTDDRGVRVARYAVIAIGAVLAVVAVSLAVFARPPRSSISYRVVSHRVDSDRQVTVTFDVEKPPLVTAECQVTAFDAKGKSVGRLIGIPVGRSGEGTRGTRVTVAVPTESRAADAGVATCHLLPTR